MPSSSSASLLRFVTVLVTVLFFASSSLAVSKCRGSVLTYGTPSDHLLAASRVELLAEAMDDIAKTSIRGGSQSFEEILLAIKGADGVMGDVIEAASRCNVCTSRTETALRGLKQVQGLEGKQGLEWIADKAKKFSSGERSRIDDFMYETLNTCVGVSPSTKVIQYCGRLAEWTPTGKSWGQDAPKLACEVRPRSTPRTNFVPIPYDPYDRDAYIQEVIKRYGINTRATKFVYDAALDPGIAVGLTSEIDRGRISKIGPGAFLFGNTDLAREAGVANTIAHELVHARNYLKGLRVNDERQAVLSGEMLETYIVCQ
jgi:hypothetical protein